MNPFRSSLRLKLGFWMLLLSLGPLVTVGVITLAILLFQLFNLSRQLTEAEASLRTNVVGRTLTGAAADTVWLLHPAGVVADWAVYGGTSAGEIWTRLDGAPANAGLDALLGDFGVEADEDMVVDPNPVSRLFGGTAVTPVVRPSAAHPITKDLAQTGVLLATARSLVARRGAPVTPTPIALTTDTAWGETDIFRLLDNINPLDDSFGGFFIALDERRMPIEMVRRMPRVKVVFSILFLMRSAIAAARALSVSGSITANSSPP